MQYEIIEEAGSIQISYDGPTLDLATFGILQLELQQISDRIVFENLAGEGILDAFDRYWIYPDAFPFWTRVPIYNRIWIESPPTKLIVRRLHYESPLEEELLLAVASVLSDPNIRSVLLGVAANMITAIGAVGLRGLSWISGNRDTEEQRPSQTIDVGPNVRAVALALAKNANGHRARLHIAHQRENERTEIQLEISPDES